MNDINDIMKEPQFLRMEQVAKMFNISRALAYRLAREGSLKAVRFGCAVRVHPVDLQAYINTHYVLQEE